MKSAKIYGSACQQMDCWGAQKSPSHANAGASRKARSKGYVKPGKSAMAKVSKGKNGN